MKSTFNERRQLMRRRHSCALSIFIFYLFFSNFSHAQISLPVSIVTPSPSPSSTPSFPLSPIASLSTSASPSPNNLIIPLPSLALPSLTPLINLPSPSSPAGASILFIDKCPTHDATILSGVLSLIKMLLGWLLPNVCAWPGVTCDANTCITSLDVGATLLTSIPAQFGQLQNLVNLTLSNNLLTGALPSFLSGLTKLENLWIDGNKFTGDLSVLSSLTSLKSLNISNNLFSGPIPSVIGSLTALETLVLRGNNFTRFTDALAQLAPLQQLTLLDIGNNNISTIADDVWTTLFSLPAIQRISADANKLTGTLQQITRALQSKTDIILNLENNYLCGFVLPTLAKQFTSATQLLLNGNCFLGTANSSLPNWCVWPGTCATMKPTNLCDLGLSGVTCTSNIFPIYMNDSGVVTTVDVSPTNALQVTIQTKNDTTEELDGDSYTIAVSSLTRTDFLSNLLNVIGLPSSLVYFMDGVRDLIGPVGNITRPTLQHTSISTILTNGAFMYIDILLDSSVLSMDFGTGINASRVIPRSIPANAAKFILEVTDLFAELDKTVVRDVGINMEFFSSNPDVMFKSLNGNTTERTEIGEGTTTAVSAVGLRTSTNAELFVHLLNYVADDKGRTYPSNHTITFSHYINATKIRGVLPALPHFYYDPDMGVLLNSGNNGGDGLFGDGDGISGGGGDGVAGGGVQHSGVGDGSDTWTATLIAAIVVPVGGVVIVATVTLIAIGVLVWKRLDRVLFLFGVNGHNDTVNF